MNENEHIIALIAKTLQGVATQQETEELQLWLNADTTHQEMYNELAVIWQKSAAVLAKPHFNAQAAWALLDQKIAASRNQPGRQSGSVVALLFSSKKAAAVLVLVTAAALAGFWWFNHTPWQTLTATSNNQQVILADESVVMLRKGSSISYPKTFDKKQRLVKLTGEAYFQVHHNNQQPFIINTPHSEVKVVGTSFLVNSQEKQDEIVVVTGKVNVKDNNGQDNQVLLSPGQRVVLQQDHFYKNEVTDSNFIAWKTGLLNFKNAPIHKILQDVSDYYGVTVTLDAAAENTTTSLNFRFENQPLNQVLDEIKAVTGLEMKKVGDKIIFYRK